MILLWYEYNNREIKHKNIRFKRCAIILFIKHVIIHTFDHTIDFVLQLLRSRFLSCDDNRLQAKWNRNAICRSPRRPLTLPRISLAKPSRDYANSGIIYFSFTLLLLSSSVSLASRKRSSTPVDEATTLESTNFEVPVGFWCRHQLFPPCKTVNHALSEDKTTNNWSILNEPSTLGYADSKSRCTAAMIEKKKNIFYWYHTLNPAKRN